MYMYVLIEEVRNFLDVYIMPVGQHLSKEDFSKQAEALKINF